jgi:hypothetical protein
MGESPGIRAARERAEAFNAKVEAKQNLDSARARANASERRIREILSAGADRLAPVVREHAARELGVYFAKKFIALAEKDLGADMAKYAYSVAERLLMSKDPDGTLALAPPEIRNWFYTVLDAGEHEYGAGIQYRNDPRRGALIAETYIEKRLVWPREVYCYRHIMR